MRGWVAAQRAARDALIAASTTNTAPSPAPHAPVKPAGVVLFPDDKAATAPSTAPADIDRLLSTAPTAIPRPISFVHAQKAVNARPQQSTPVSAPSTPAAATATLPTTQRSISSPVTPTTSASPAAMRDGHSNGNGLHTPLAAQVRLSSPKLAPSLNSALTSTTASLHSTSASLAAADDNTFHPALYALFPAEQLGAWSAWPAAVISPGTGLHNLGNSCFMNATLQALTHSPMLANYCLSRQHSQHCPIKHQQPAPQPQHQPPKPTSGFNWRSPQPLQSSLLNKQQLPPFCLFCALEDNIVRSFNQAAAFSPSVIFHRLPAISRSLRPGRQEDAHEFLRLAFDMLQSNVLAADLPSRPPSSSSSSASTASKVQLPLPKGSSVPAALFASLTPAQLHRIKETSVLYQIFSGYYRSTLTCRSCHQPSHTFEPFLDLSLSIPTSSASSTPLSSGYQRFPQLGFQRPYQPFSQPQQPQPPLTLHQCLRAFTSEEQLDTDNMYKCTSCKKKTRAAKRLSIHTAPSVLVVHLKRFEHSGLGMGGGGGKIGRMVRFDTVLDISQYMSEAGGGGAGKVEYELYCVLVHAGSTLYSGHYYSFVKAADGRWYEMNDSTVQRRTVEEVLAQKAYILFYNKTVVDTGVKGAASANGSAAGAGKSVKEVDKQGERRKEWVPAPVEVVGQVTNKGVDEMIRALMNGKRANATITTHVNGRGIKVAEERKEQPAEKKAMEERKEERGKVVQEQKQQAETVVPAVVKLTEPTLHSEVAKEDKREEQKEMKMEEEEKKVDGSPVSLASGTIHHTATRISLLAPSAPISTSTAHPPPPLSVRPPGSPLSPPSALSSPASSSGSIKRKQVNGSPPTTGLYPGMPSFRTGSQAKFTAFAAASNGSAMKKVKRDGIGAGIGGGIRLVPYSSSSSDEDEQQEQAKELTNGVPHRAEEAKDDSKLERKEEAVLLTQHEKTTTVVPINPLPAPAAHPAADEQKSATQYAENNDRKRRRVDIQANAHPTAAPHATNATRFDPHAGRHTAHSHYGSEVGTWEDDDESRTRTEQERRERDELLRRLERERSGRAKDGYDVMYDEGKKRKVRGEKNEWRGVAVKEGENLMQREHERRDARGDRQHERHRSSHSDSRSSRHSDGDRRRSHHHHRDDRDRSKGQHREVERTMSSSSQSSHSSRRDSRDSHHSHHNRRDDNRDRSRHSWSHRR